jgi:hypothetical protein
MEKGTKVKLVKFSPLWFAEFEGNDLGELTYEITGWGERSYSGDPAKAVHTDGESWFPEVFYGYENGCTVWNEEHRVHLWVRQDHVRAEVIQ